MENERTRKVLIAARGTSDRSVLRHDVQRILAARNEIPDFIEIKTYQELIRALNHVRENLIELVVITGFSGEWHTIFKNSEKLSKKHLAAFFINKNTALFPQAKRHGFKVLEPANSDQLGRMVNESLDKKSYKVVKT